MGVVAFALISVGDKFKAIWDRLIVKGGIFIAAIMSWVFSLVGYPNAVIDFIVMLMIFDILTKFYVETITSTGKFTLKTLWDTCFTKNVINSKQLKNGLFAKIFVYFILFTIAEQSTIDGLMFKDSLKFLAYNGICTVELYSVMENITKVHPKFNFIKRWLIGMQKKFMDNAFEDDGTDIDLEAKKFFEDEPEGNYNELSGKEDDNSQDGSEWQ